MKRKNIIFILLTIILSMLLLSCTKTKTGDKILFKNIDSIGIVFDKGNEVVYTPKEDKTEIEEFINEFNEGRSFGNIEDIIHDTKVTINFKDGTSIVVQQ